MFFYLKVSSKDKRVLKNFLRFFAKLESLSVSVKVLSKNKKRKFVTILKSPHVNKTAQEQFEYRFYSKHFLISSPKPLTFFLLLKKLKNLSFSGINLEVKGFLDKNKMHKHVLHLVTPDNLVLKSAANLYSSIKVRKLQHQKSVEQAYKKQNPNFLLYLKYVQLFDLYGEICLKKFFIHNKI